MSIKNYYLTNSKKIELALFLILILFLPLSESVKQICFFCLILFFTVNKIFERKLTIDFFCTGLIIFLINSLISVPFSADPYLGFKWSLNIFTYAFLYLYLINEIKSEKHINLIEKFILLGLLAGLVWGIFVWKLYWNKPRLEILSIGAPNSTGTFLGLSTIFLLISLISSKINKSSKKILFFYFVIGFLLIIGLILNGSRGMYFGLLLSSLFLSFYFFIKLKKSVPFFILIVIIITILIGAIFYPELNSRFLDLSSLYERFINWDKAFQCFINDPLVGGGSKLCYNDPDNLFLAILAKTGILGFLGFVILLYFYLKQFRKNVFLLVFLIFILSNGIFETSLKHENAIAFVTYVFLVSHACSNN